MGKRSKKKRGPSQSARGEQPAAPMSKPVAQLTPPTQPAPAIAANSAPFSAMFIFRVLLIIGAVFWIYGPVLHGDWLWDDDTLISENDVVHDPFGLINIWFAPTSLIDYFPLTVSVDWLEWQFWGGNTFPYHLTNLILHAISSLLVWRLLSKLGLRLAWLGGLLFAIHPVTVESVAWMAELKNTLSMPPFLLAACAWIDYERRGNLEDYCRASVFFLVAMLCKSSMVNFPVAILLYAWWRRDRVTSRNLVESAPFFAISLAIGLTLIALLRHGVGEQFIPLGGVLSRLACGGLSLSFYFSKCVLPLNLLPIYPQWDINPPTLVQFLPWPVIGIALFWLWTRHTAWARNVLFGFGFFLVMLVPFVGFRPISFMRFAWVMDHFLYLPILGLLALAVAALGQLDDRVGATKRPYLIAAVAALFVVLAVGSHRYAKVYVNSEKLWSYTCQHDPEAWPAFNNLGNVYLHDNRLPEAEKEFIAALILNPKYAEAQNNLGVVYLRTGRLNEALKQFYIALELQPDLGSALQNSAELEDYFKAHPLERQPRR